MNYEILTKSQMTLTGYKKRFTGKIQDRFIQEEKFFNDTRDKQEYLYNNSIDNDMRKIYCIINNILDDSFDFYIAYNCGEKTLSNYEQILIAEQKYAVFSTTKCKYPTRELITLTKKLHNNTLCELNYTINTKKPILEITYWYMPESENRENRFIEVLIPINM